MGGAERLDACVDSSMMVPDALRRLSKIISPHTVLCPTRDHNNDFATTLHAELRSNERLRKTLEPSGIVTIKKEHQPEVSRENCRTAMVPLEGNPATAAGRHVTSACDTSIELRKHELKAFFQQHRNSLIIDVREPHEFAFAQDWSPLGFDAPPENVPLTRLTGQLPRLLTLALEQDREIIFICRSGKRSGKAAEIVKRLGVDKVHHITGGIALNVSQACAFQDAAVDTGFVI